ncbi:hypothetical protein [Bradyrhizobium yuanmingense]|uniref:hypothetical protein n=1 Tax=Bradyrhizobium yuanmingense TaxID=108015 RepID=UPI00055ED36F|nr:hypothetical protein [Bradyrhizobium yuanmingense]
MSGGYAERELLVAEKTYRAIGYFIFEFSQTEYTIRHYVGRELKIEEKHFAAVMQSYDVALLCAVAKRVFEANFDKERYEVAERLLNRFYKINEQRVRVAHGLWMPHFNGGTLHHVSRAQLKPQGYIEQTTLLEKLGAEAQEIKFGFFELFGVVNEEDIEF